MFRRMFLRAFGAGIAAGGSVAVGSRVASAAETDGGTQSGNDGSADFSLGDINLGDVDVIDTHVHPLSRETLSQSYLKWVDSFVDLAVPAYDFEDKAELRGKLRQEFIDQIWGYSRQPGYNNFMARSYGIPPTIEAIDAELSKHFASDAALTAHVNDVFKRNRIPAVVLQSREPEPIAPPSVIPTDKFVWTWPFVDMFRPAWAKEKGVKSIDDLTTLIESRMETAVANGCRGFKNGAAYYRTYALANVTKKEADAAFKVVLKATPKVVNQRGVPTYESESVTAALRTYEDYLFRRVYVKVGELDSLAIIHTAVAMHPSLRSEFNDPRPLFDVFKNEEIQEAGTRFVLIHTGYPNHHVISSMISQFPNVYADMSFIGQFPGALEETYRAFLAFGPSEKIMHGGDINTVPDGIAFCAWNSRAVLVRVLNDYKKYYGWTQDDVLKTANNILHGNARRVFRIS